eukprot:217079_1
MVNGIKNGFPFIFTLPIYTILFILESMIFMHFAIKTYALDIMKSIRYYTLTLLFIVLITLFLELWTIVFDLSSTIPPQNGYCFGQLYVRILSFILFQATMFLFWMIRLRHTFDNSIFSMFISVPFLCIVFMITSAIFLKPSHYSINLSFTNGYGCIIALNKIDNIPIQIILVIGQIMAFIMNIFFGALFYYKLAKFQEMINRASATTTIDDKDYAINILMQKHTLLASISVISTIIAYITFNLLIFTVSTSADIVYVFQYGFLLIDIDMVIKTLTCLLMFRLYQQRFYQICWCCIRIAAVIDCSCLEQKKHKPMFHRLNQVVRENKGSKVSPYEDRYGFDSRHKKPVCAELELTVNGAPNKNKLELIGNYKYLCFLVKLSTNNRIYQQSINKEERIENEKSIFRQISRYKSKRQSIARRKNEQQMYGSFSYKGYNFYFRKRDQTLRKKELGYACAFPFILALKCVCSDKDGEILSQFHLGRLGAKN